MRICCGAFQNSKQDVHRNTPSAMRGRHAQSKQYRIQACAVPGALSLKAGGSACSVAALPGRILPPSLPLESTEAAMCTHTVTSGVCGCSKAHAWRAFGQACSTIKEQLAARKAAIAALDRLPLEQVSCALGPSYSAKHGLVSVACACCLQIYERLYCKMAQVQRVWQGSRGQSDRCKKIAAHFVLCLHICMTCRLSIS